MLTLSAKLREKGLKLDTLRKAGEMPAVFYGKKEASTPISLRAVDFLKVWEEAGESTVVVLDTPKGKVESLIHEVALDPITGTPKHADFYVFEKGHKVKVELPIEFEGVAPAVKDLGGVLVKVLYNLKVEGEPSHLPHNIKIDISTLKEFGHQILAKDIAVPAGVTLLENSEEVVVLVSAPREEKEEEAAPVDLSTIEVEKKGKDKDGEAAEGAEAPAEEVGKDKKAPGKDKE